MKKFPELRGNIKADVVVIGGGIAGILCAELLSRSKINCILLEADRICRKNTCNTTAKITAQHGLIYSKISDMCGREKAAMYLKANLEAIDLYENMCKTIACDFEIKKSFVYSLDDREKLEKEIKALADIGYDADILEELQLPFETKGAVSFRHQAQFNPLKFIARQCCDLEIYENSAVRSIEGNRVITENGSVFAQCIIVAAHYPFINIHGAYFMKMYQHRSYVVALENAPDVGGMYVDEADGGMSFRNYKNYLMIGGWGHKTGTAGGGWSELIGFSKKYYSDSEAKFFWAAQDCITLDGIPYIGRYSKRTHNMYVVTGFNKWGMTSSMIAANVIRDLIVRNSSEYERLFDPSRRMAKKQLVCNIASSAVNLLASGKRCSHMGCALKWNSAEKTWDCPCHGSRFTENGEIIDDPAKKAIKVK